MNPQTSRTVLEGEAGAVRLHTETEQEFLADTVEGKHAAKIRDHYGRTTAIVWLAYGPRWEEPLIACLFAMSEKHVKDVLRRNGVDILDQKRAGTAGKTGSVAA